MISIQEAQDLMERFVMLRERCKISTNTSDHNELKKQLTICAEKFAYLITMRTDKYKGFCNYDDLNQDGFEALFKAMNSYNPSKGSWFWWAHKYIETRIVRSANAHSTIRYPIKFAKENPPHKENKIPLMIENECVPDKNVEQLEMSQAVRDAVDTLSRRNKQVVQMAFGFDGGKPSSVSKICDKMNISRLNCLKIIEDALCDMKENIRI